MAETVSIILDFLRQNNFMKAEAALRLELQARQGSTESVILLPRDLDLLLGEPVQEEVISFSDKISAADNSLRKDALDFWSKVPSDRLTALDLQLKGWEAESVRCDEVSRSLGTLTMQQKLMYEPIEWDSYCCSSLDSTSLPSATYTSGEIRPSYEPVGEPRIQDIESGISPQRVGFQRSKRSMQGVGPRCQKDQITDGGTGAFERIIGVQNETEEFQIINENNTSRFLQQDPLDTYTGRVDCFVEDLSKAPPLCEPHGQTADELKKGTRRCERCCYISLNGQPEMGANQLEKCTIVDESRDLSEYHSFNGNTMFEQSLPFTEFLENHYDSFASVSYGASTGNDWFDHRKPSHTFPKTSSKGISTNNIQPFFLSCPIIEDSTDRYEQQDEKQVVHGVSKVYGLERESGPVDFLKDIAVPWEVAIPNEHTQVGGSEEGKACTDKSRHKGFQKLPHVKIRSTEKNLNLLKENNGSFHFDSALDAGHHAITNSVSEPSFSLGSFLDIPVGQDIPLAGAKWQNGSSHLSVSQAIAEDTPELLSGFATLGDEPSNSGAGYPQGYWDSDAYEDDEDPGYHRQPIEDEAWFLAHEIDYPSDDDKAKSSKPVGGHFKQGQDNHDYEDFSQVEEELYFSGEQFYKAGHNEPQTSSGHEEVNVLNLYAKSSQCNLVERSLITNMSYDGQLMDAVELKLAGTEHLWQGFDSEINQIDLLGGEKNYQRVGKSYEEVSSDIDGDKYGSARFSGAGISSNVADVGSKARDNMHAAYCEWERESLGEPELQGYQINQIMLGPDNMPHRLENDAARCHGDFTGGSDAALRCLGSDWVSNGFCPKKQNAAGSSSGPAKFIDGLPYDRIQKSEDEGGTGFGGFSFPSPSSTHDLATSKIGCGKSVQITEITPLIEDADAYGAGITRPDKTLASWKRKSNDSSPVLSPRGEAFLNAISSVQSSVSSHSTNDYLLCEARKERDDAGAYGEDGIGATVVDNEETAALQEQFQQLKLEEDKYEIFNLRIVHRKNRTGFEEDKNFPVVINSVVAGRYLVTEYLGSAAFSKAIQARDLQTGMDVCMKIIKNNKDFFDQSLDEIKLLKFVNKHDPADQYHILRLYDYFYYREHLFIVCELLRANLYEFLKFNRESGGEVYFTMSRLQSITRQCLEALEFLHGLGLIHCDLKPENILVKSYSHCEVKVIDLGSSCFQSDHLCPYVQSRSYRAPEVILGLLYSQKIDIWSLGCILAELCSGHVLFQNDSIATLLARVFGIIGPVNPEILAKGQDTHKYFTKNYILYERNQETNQLEYLLPKKTSLRYRLPMGDQGFVDFVGYLLQINPENRPTASEALKHPWLSYPYEPLSS